MRMLIRLFRWSFGGLVLIVDRAVDWLWKRLARPRAALSAFAGWWTVRKVGVVMLIAAILAGVAGYAQHHPGPFSFSAFMDDFYANISTELISLSVTVLVIDALTYRREAQDRRARLIRELRNKDNALAQRAADDLRAYGWLLDGSLAGADLWGANLAGAELEGSALRGARMGRSSFHSANLEEADLREADLSRADLQGAALNKADLRRADLSRANLQGAMLDWVNLHSADLSRANLQDASLRWASLQEADLSMALFKGASLRNANLAGARLRPDVQLYHAQRLRGAVLPDGRRYDGRYNLPGDLADAAARGVEVASPEALARWYHVSLEDYEAGQAWHAAHPREDWAAATAGHAQGLLAPGDADDHEDHMPIPRWPEPPAVRQ